MGSVNRTGRRLIEGVRESGAAILGRTGVLEEVITGVESVADVLTDDGDGEVADATVVVELPAVAADTVGYKDLPVFRRPIRRNPDMIDNRPYDCGGVDR